MKMVKLICCIATAVFVSGASYAEFSTKVVDRLILKKEYKLAAEVLADAVNDDMSQTNIDNTVACLEDIVSKLRGGDPSLAVKKFIPPDPEYAYKEVIKDQPEWIQVFGPMTGWFVAWKNDAQRVLVANRYLDTGTLMSADEAKRELAIFDAMKRCVEKLKTVVDSRFMDEKISDKDFDHYIKVRKSLDGIKQRLKTQRTHFLSYEVVSPYFYQAHCHLFVGISDSTVRKSSFNTKYSSEEVKGFRDKGVNLLSQACHVDWLYSCTQDVRDQFFEIYKYLKENVTEREWEEYKAISTLTISIDPSKPLGATRWWK